MGDSDAPRARRARIGDVAAEAGVSITTVSHALSGARAVSAETRLRVLQAAAALGYAPDRLASGLRRRRTGLVGFVGDNVATTPFAGRLISGARDFALDHDSLVLVTESDGDPAREQRVIDRLLAQRVDGLLIARMYHQRVPRPDLPDDVPVVLVDAVPATGWSADAVIPDEAQITVLACEHLLQAGHRDIAYVGTSDTSRAARARLIGIRAGLGLGSLGLPAERLVTSSSDAAGGREAGARLFATTPRPTAIICFNDQIAMGVMQAAARRGLRVPQDVSVVGVDDLHPVADALDPGLTTVALPHAEMGRWAMARLLARIERTLDDPPGHLEIVPGTLVERGSVAPPAG